MFVKFSVIKWSAQPRVKRNSFVFCRRQRTQQSAAAFDAHMADNILLLTSKSVYMTPTRKELIEKKRVNYSFNLIY